MQCLFHFYRFLYPKRILYCLLIFACACHTPDLAEIDYPAFSSVVGPEGKRLEFYEAKGNTGRNIDMSLFPVLVFEPGTFSADAVIKLGIQRMSANNLPEGYTALSANTYTWTVNSSVQEPKKGVQMIIPFQEPDTSIWVENYKSRIRLFRFISGKEISDAANWEAVENFELDTINRSISTTIKDFNHGYCVLFREIRRSDNISITTKGAIQTIQSAAADNYFSNSVTNQAGFYFRNGKSVFAAEHLWTDDFAIGFTVEGSKPGIYTGNQIKVNYKYKKQNNQWMYNFNATSQTIITITRYGTIGNVVEGKITGPLTTANGQTIDFTMNFKLIRTR